MRSAEPKPVAILGAGLTGLSAAEALGRCGMAYRVFEQSARAGGLAVTDEEAGYRFDRTGHLLHLRSESLRAEVLSWLGDECLSLKRKSVVWSHGVYTRYPFQANTFGLPPAVAYECLRDFVLATFAAKPARIESFEDFCLTHFGAGISRHFMLPYNSRLWGVPPSEITAAWCQRFVPLPRLEDVLAGAVGFAERELGYNTEFLYPRGGIGALSQALLRRVSNIRLNSAPRSIRAEARELLFDGERVPYTTLVSTIPLPVLLSLFDRLPPEIEGAAHRLRATPLYYLDVALSRRVLQDFHWAYVPEERYPFYRVGCYTHFSEALAPAGCASLYVELVERSAPDLPTLLPRVLAGLLEMRLIQSANDVAFTRLRHIEHAYVIYDHDHAQSVHVIMDFLESLDVISTGRYGGWNYSSMEDALIFGREAARRVSEVHSTRSAPE